MTHGSRDVGKVAKVSNWPELAGATQKESNELGRNPHRCYGHMTEV